MKFAIKIALSILVFLFIVLFFSNPTQVDLEAKAIQDNHNETMGIVFSAPLSAFRTNYLLFSIGNVTVRYNAIVSSSTGTCKYVGVLGNWFVLDCVKQ